MCILDSLPKCAKVCQSVPTAWGSSLGELVVRMKNKVSLLNHLKVCILDSVPKCANSLREQQGRVGSYHEKYCLSFKQFQSVHFRQCAKVCILDNVPKCAKVC